MFHLAMHSAPILWWIGKNCRLYPALGMPYLCIRVWQLPVCIIVIANYTLILRLLRKPLSTHGFTLRHCQRTVVGLPLRCELLLTVCHFHRPKTGVLSNMRTSLLTSALLTGTLSLLVFPLSSLYFPPTIPTSHFAVKSTSLPPVKSAITWSGPLTLPNKATIYAYEAGPRSGPLVLLLHGYPETALTSWKYQIPYLANLGYHVVAYDMRGFNMSSKHDAHMFSAEEDTRYVVEHFLKSKGDGKKAIVVGHDWGAIIAWTFSLCNPDLVDKLVTLNVPHPLIFREFSLSHPSQLFIKSWYIWFQNLPIISEYLLRRNDYALEISTFFGPGASFAGTFSLDDIEKYKQAWSQEGALTGMLSWYRQLPQLLLDDSSIRKNEKCGYGRLRGHIPLLAIWGKQDNFLDWRMCEGSLKYVDKGSPRVIKYVENATHWVQHQEPDVVNKHIKEFLEGRTKG